MNKSSATSRNLGAWSYDTLGLQSAVSVVLVLYIPIRIVWGRHIDVIGELIALGTDISVDRESTCRGKLVHIIS